MGNKNLQKKVRKFKNASEERNLPRYGGNRECPKVNEWPRRPPRQYACGLFDCTAPLGTIQILRKHVLGDFLTHPLSVYC